MSVKLIKIRNVLGVSEVEFEPGKITEISGRNAAGKSSILNAIRSVLKASSSAKLLRNGEDKGEVVLVLDDGTEIGRKFTSAGSYPFANKEGMTASSPVSLIRTLTGEFALNPVDFITATDSARVEHLLACVDIQVDEKRLEEITGMHNFGDELDDPLGLIDTLRGDIYEKRTGVNRALKEAKAANDRLRASLPENPMTADDAKEEYRTVVERSNEIVLNAKAAKAEMDVALSVKLGKIDREIEKLQEKKEAARVETHEAIEKLREETAATTAPLREEAAKLRQTIDECARTENTLEIVRDNENDIENLESETQALTRSIACLDEYRLELLDGLPFADLNIIDGKLYHGEVPFEQVNSAEQVRIAFELAQMSAGELGLVCVDGLELLDREHYDSLIERARNSNVQLILTAVSDDELKISA